MTIPSILVKFKSSLALKLGLLIAKCCAMIVLCIALMTILGYWQDIHILYRWYGVTPMAVNTSIAFFIISLGLFALADYVDQRLMRENGK